MGIGKLIILLLTYAVGSCLDLFADEVNYRTVAD